MSPRDSAVSADPVVVEVAELPRREGQRAVEHLAREQRGGTGHRVGHQEGRQVGVVVACARPSRCRRRSSRRWRRCARRCTRASRCLMRAEQRRELVGVPEVVLVGHRHELARDAGRARGRARSWRRSRAAAASARRRSGDRLPAPPPRRQSAREPCSRRLPRRPSCGASAARIVSSWRRKRSRGGSCVAMQMATSGPWAGSGGGAVERRLGLLQSGCGRARRPPRSRRRGAPGGAARSTLLVAARLDPDDSPEPAAEAAWRRVGRGRSNDVAARHAVGARRLRLAVDDELERADPGAWVKAPAACEHRGACADCERAR